MSVFQEIEIDYLAGGRQLGRIATVGADGTPHVVPVAWIYNAVRDRSTRRPRARADEEVHDVARTGASRS